MFCPQCRCEFAGWTDKCPDCHVPLVEELAPIPERSGKSISYEALVDLVRENGGQLRIDLSTTEVGMERELRFPYRGYKFAWAKRMQGNLDNNLVDLTTTRVGREKEWGFPYQGYGYAWVKRMEGHVGGNPITLTASKVGRDKETIFPFRGYGFAWTRELSGECGDRLRANLLITDASRRKGWIFPYFGFGAAWENEGILTLALNEQS